MQERKLIHHSRVRAERFWFAFVAPDTMRRATKVKNASAADINNKPRMYIKKYIKKHNAWFEAARIIMAWNVFSGANACSENMRRATLSSFYTIACRMSTFVINARPAALLLGRWLKILSYIYIHTACNAQLHHPSVCCSSCALNGLHKSVIPLRCYCFRHDRVVKSFSLWRCTRACHF